MSKLKVYYAHCIAIYNTKQEARDIALLESLGFEVINPNSKELDTAYEKRKAEIAATKAAGADPMELFRPFAQGDGSCDLIAFRGMTDGAIPAGVAKEIEMFKEVKKPVIELPSCVTRRSFTVQETREALLETGCR
jgi:hypothetical protein